MPDGAEGPPLAAPDVPVPAPELADDPDAPPLAAAPPAPPPAPPPPPPPCAKTGAEIAKDSAAVRRSVFRFMTFSSVKKVDYAEMTMVPFPPLASGVQLLAELPDQFADVRGILLVLIPLAELHFWLGRRWIIAHASHQLS